MCAYNLAIVTPSFAPDFDRCRQLTQSVMEFVDPTTRHYIVVDRRDISLFRALADYRTEIIAVEDVLPCWVFRLPWARRWWLSLKTKPVRNWILQQVVKLALPQYLHEDILLFVDSDVAFVRPFFGQSFIREGAVRLFRIPGDANIKSQHPWHRTAARMLGLPPVDYFGARYIGNIVSWRRDNVLRLHEHIAQTTGRSWLESALSQWRLSEYILYGVFVDHVLGDAAGHYADSENLCLEYWDDRPMSGDDTKMFLNSIQDHHVAVMISAKARMSVSSYTHLLSRVGTGSIVPARTSVKAATPRISVGIPVYNAEAYLTESLDSVLKQTVDDFEIVISDNGSTDTTPNICRDYAARDRRIRYERREDNHGSYWNFNRVLSMARGHYFKWLAYDDLIAPSYLERCTEVLDQDPSVVWCQSRIGLIDATGAEVTASINTYDQPDAPLLREHSVAGFDPVGVGEGRTSNDCGRRFAAALMGVAWCLDCFGLVRMDALRKTRGFRSIYGAEKTLVAELSLLGRYIEIPEVLHRIRVHDKATGHVTSHSRQEREAPLFWQTRCIPPRVQLLLDKFSAVARAPITPYDRVRCGLVLLRYMCQAWRWRTRTSVIRKNRARIC